MVEFRPDYGSAFKKQYAKLSETDKDAADIALRDLVAMVNMPANAEARKHAAVRLRAKVIQKFRKRQGPKRMEASFTGDGRIVWMLDRPLIRFLYIGGHEVLNKE